jgi:hypothetical protein
VKFVVALWIMSVVLLACGAITAGAIVSDVPPLAAVGVDVVLLPMGCIMAWMTLND